jgi:hypothetical protein
MRRPLLGLFAFAALSAWVGAQGPAPLPAEVQVKQFKANRTLIESLVDHGVYLAEAEDPLDRAEECRKTARVLANYLERAAGAGDADRVAEFAGLYGAVVRDGLVPNLETARRTIPEGSPRWPDLQKAREKAAKDFFHARASVPADGPVGQSDKVKAALRALEGLAGKL